MNVTKKRTQFLQYECLRRYDDAYDLSIMTHTIFAFNYYHAHGFQRKREYIIRRFHMLKPVIQEKVKQRIYKQCCEIMPRDLAVLVTVYV